MDPINYTSFIFGSYERSYCLILANKIGVLPAIFIRALLTIEQECTNFINDKKYGRGWFTATIDTIQQKCGLDREEQTKAINKLLRLEVIDVEVFGLPAVRNFKIDFEEIEQIYGFLITKKED